MTYKEFCLYHKLEEGNLKELNIGDKTYKICFHNLAQYSEFFENNNHEDLFNTFPNTIKDAQSELNIIPGNLDIFMNILSGKSEVINKMNSFDLYKLSSFFKFKSVTLSEDLKQAICSIWQFQPKNFDDELYQFLQYFDKSVENDKQRTYLNEFIKNTQIISILTANIGHFFQSQYIDHFSPFLIYFLLLESDKENIPQDELFNFILKSKEDYQILDIFLDLDYLSAHNRNNFFLFIFGRYTQLMTANKFYFDYLNNQQDEQKSTQLLKDSSRHGNLAASHQLTSLNKPHSEEYELIFDAQKESSSQMAELYQKMKQNEEQKTGKDEEESITNDDNYKNDNDNEESNKNEYSESNDNDDDNSTDGNSNDDDDEFFNNEEEEFQSDDNNNEEEEEEEDIKDRLPNSLSHMDDDMKDMKQEPRRSMSDRPKRFRSNPSSYNQNKRMRHGPRFTEIELRNQEIWRETESIIESKKYTDNKNKKHDISKQLRKSLKETETIDKKHSYSKLNEKLFKDIKKWGYKEKKTIYKKIEFTPEGTFEAARRLIEKERIHEVCVLNFASATKPGGGVKNGRTAQEETLSRQSSLYFTLKKDDTMYKYFKEHKSPFYRHFMIYSPHVVVIRNEKYDLVPPILVSVITSAAVNYALLSKKYHKGERDKDVYECMKNRCRKILELAISKNNKAIVLGAFGCGVFKNKPENVSKIFKELIVDEYYGMFFNKIVFAIKSSPKKKNTNLEVFASTFNKK